MILFRVLFIDSLIIFIGVKNLLCELLERSCLIHAVLLSDLMHSLDQSLPLELPLIVYSRL